MITALFPRTASGRQWVCGGSFGEFQFTTPRHGVPLRRRVRLSRSF